MSMNLLLLKRFGGRNLLQGVCKKSWPVLATRAMSTGGMGPDLSQTQNVNINLHPRPVTNKDLIDHDTGLGNFIKRTYLYTGGSIVGSLGLASLMAQSDAILSHPGLALGAMIIGGFGGILGIAHSQVTIQKDVYPKDENHSVAIYSSTNSPIRIFYYGLFVSGMSVGLAPLFYLYPDAIMPALVASSTVFSSAVLFAHSRPVGYLSAWGPSLATGLTSFLGIIIAGIGSDLILGPEATLSLALHNANLYLGIPLFTGLVAYDTQKAIDMYHQELPDHLACAASLYLDFMNIFIRFVQIIAQHNQKQN